MISFPTMTTSCLLCSLMSNFTNVVMVNSFGLDHSAVSNAMPLLDLGRSGHMVLKTFSVHSEQQFVSSHWTVERGSDKTAAAAGVFYSLCCLLVFSTALFLFSPALSVSPFKKAIMEIWKQQQTILFSLVVENGQLMFPYMIVRKLPEPKNHQHLIWNAPVAGFITIWDIPMYFFKSFQFANERIWLRNVLMMDIVPLFTEDNLPLQ